MTADLQPCLVEIRAGFVWVQRLVATSDGPAVDSQLAFELIGEVREERLPGKREGYHRDAWVWTTALGTGDQETRHAAVAEMIATLGLTCVSLTATIPTMFEVKS